MGGGSPMAGGPPPERKTTSCSSPRNANGPLVTFLGHTIDALLTPAGHYYKSHHIAPLWGRPSLPRVVA